MDETKFNTDKVLLRFNNNKINSQSVYPIIITDINGYNNTILIESWASSLI